MAVLLSAFSLIVIAIAESVDAPTRAGFGGEKAPALLLANVWTPAIDPTGWRMSEKYDGVRGFWDGRVLRTRNGNIIHATADFLAELPADTVLDGELWMGRGRFEAATSVVLADKTDERWEAVRFMVFDAPDVKGVFEERMKFLAKTIPSDSGFVKVVPQER